MSKYADLSGRGGLAASGRWHTHPKPILYCSDEPYTAYREVLGSVIEPFLIPADYKMLRIGVPSTTNIDTIDEVTLDPLWKGPNGWRVCSPLGDQWLRECRSSLLKVPSAARPGHFNYIVNPVHRAADHLELLEVFIQPFPSFVTQP
jgi:RES domain-containing protein